MAKTSAGILLYRRAKYGLEVLLVHPGGPFWAQKDSGAWSIPKGEFESGEDALVAAKREFAEETGFEIEKEFIELEPVKQSAVKTVYAWAAEGDLDASAICSNTFSLQWPPKSGRYEEFPEVDRAEWFDLPTAKRKIVAGQLSLLAQLEALVG
ncbi:MAG: NUDIX domain-containing protein [Gammaproteobacteria bacterium]|jgi:predicted NUDIX family NTP pyrophosphohydrolase|nr:NUDIX domain-containing protein [Gammaproteobacteria bacterium]